MTDPVVLDEVPVTRPDYSPVEQIAALQRQVDDLQSTLLVRVNRRPTGDIEPTVRSTPKADTLIMNGQTPLRTDYPVLWQWAQDQGLVIAGLFTVGNGSTTFGLPDFRGRVPLGVGTLGADTYALGDYDGASTRAISTANLPVHDHNVAVTAHGTHTHNITTNNQGGHNHGLGSDGSHSGHQPSGFGGAGGGAALIQQNDTTSGSHAHGGLTGSVSDHGHGGSADAQGPTTHTVSESSIGSGTLFDVKQPSIAINWLIYV